MGKTRYFTCKTLSDLYSGTSLRSGTYEHAGRYHRIDANASDSGGYSQSEQTDYFELTSGNNRYKQEKV